VSTAHEQKSSCLLRKQSPQTVMTHSFYTNCTKFLSQKESKNGKKISYKILMTIAASP